MTGEENTLEMAVAALGDAQAAVYTARRAVTAAIVTAYLNGETVARIAMRTGKDVVEVRNLLAAAQVTRGG